MILPTNFANTPHYSKFYSATEAIELCNKVVSSGKPNFAGIREVVKSGYNVEAFRFLLKGYPKETMVSNGIAIGWQLGWHGSPLLAGKVISNHPSVERDYPLQTKTWLEDQVAKGMLVDPIDRKTLQ